MLSLKGFASFFTSHRTFFLNHDSELITLYVLCQDNNDQRHDGLFVSSQELSNQLQLHARTRANQGTNKATSIYNSYLRVIQPTDCLMWDNEYVENSIKRCDNKYVKAMYKMLKPMRQAWFYKYYYYYNLLNIFKYFQ